MPAREPLATEHEVAAYLKKKPSTLRWWRCRGYGPPFRKVGRSVRYEWAAVDAWTNPKTP